MLPLPFQLANASILPQVSQVLARSEGHLSSLAVSGLVAVPQIIVALLAPWAGRTAAFWGRRPLLLLGLATLPIRCALVALTTDPILLFSGIGASLSTLITGIITQKFGYAAGLM